MSWFKNITSGAAGIAVVIAIPVALCVNGVRKVWEDNPKGADDPTTLEYYKHNARQFGEGITIGYYSADKGFTAENVGAETYRKGRGAVETVGGIVKGFTEEAEKDLGGTSSSDSGGAYDEAIPEGSTDPQTIDECIKDPVCTPSELDAH